MVVVDEDFLDSCFARIFLLKFTNPGSFSLTIITNILVLEALSFKVKTRNGICVENLLAFFYFGVITLVKVQSFFQRVTYSTSPRAVKSLTS